MSIKAKENLRYQILICIFGVMLFSIKILAWYITQSIAIFTDTLESITNVITGFIGLYTLYLASIPKDKNHPYGHGKAEFISASIEGALIMMAGIIILIEALSKLNSSTSIEKLDYGIYLIALTASINYIVGKYAIIKGKKNNSLALIASGHHLKSDTYSTIGIILGLAVVYYTKLFWLDRLIAITFALIILITGYKIVRKAISGIMDEADEKILKEIRTKLVKANIESNMDLNDLRVIKYGSDLHFDCSINLPENYTVAEANKRINKLEEIIKENFGNNIEVFIQIGNP